MVCRVLASGVDSSADAFHGCQGCKNGEHPYRFSAGTTEQNQDC